MRTSLFAMRANLGELPETTPTGIRSFTLSCYQGLPRIIVLRVVVNRRRRQDESSLFADSIFFFCLFWCSLVFWGGHRFFLPHTDFRTIPLVTCLYFHFTLDWWSPLHPDIQGEPKDKDGGGPVDYADMLDLIVYIFTVRADQASSHT